MVVVKCYHSLFLFMAKTAAATKATHVGASTASAQTATTPGERPTAYSVYPGKVIRTDPVTRKMSVVIMGNVQLDGCTYMSDSLASILGFSQAGMPTVGAEVLTLYTPNKSYVVGGVGATVVDNPTAFSVPAAGDIDFEVINEPAYGVRRGEQDKMLAAGYTPGKDVLPGEKEYTNNMGVWLRLLMNMAQLSAGELAKVEVSLVNDMVRIVDNYFAHHNVGGDKLIWAADGKCVEEDHFTAYGFEADGKQDENSKLVDSSSNVVNPSSIKDPANSTGRWRKSTYIGFLGDMIHTWVSDPTKALSNYADSAARAGKYRCWVGADGMLMVQAVGGVHIQVSPRVVIPEVKHNWLDPEFDIEKAFKNIEKKFLKMWGQGADGWKDVSVACWQMRAWARYITLWHSLERWNALKKSKYCDVSSEKSSPSPEPTAKEKDKEEINPTAKTPYSGTAILSIDPSGTISLVAQGDEQHPGTASVVMNQGNVQVASSGNMELQCGGTLSISAKNISMKAVDHIEVVSIAGALWLKARSAWNALCEKGRMWLKSDYEEGMTDSADAYPVDGGTPPEVPQAGAYAICIDAAEGKLALRGKKEVTATTTGPEAPINVQTQSVNSPINIYNDNGGVNIYSGTGITAKSNAYFTLGAPTVLFDSVSVHITDNLWINPASIEFTGFIRTRQVAARDGFVSKNPGVGKVTKHIDPEEEIKKGEKTYTKLKGILDEFPSENSMSETIYELDDYMWQFNEWSGVGEGKVEEWVSYKQSPVGSEVEAKGAKTGPVSTLSDVVWDLCCLNSFSPTTSPESYPWPGQKSQIWYYKGDAPSLSEFAEDKDGDPDKGGIKAMEKKDYTFYVQQ